VVAAVEEEEQDEGISMLLDKLSKESRPLKRPSELFALRRVGLEENLYGSREVSGLVAAEEALALLPCAACRLNQASCSLAFFSALRN
jgi:hypothetical protein